MRSVSRSPGLGRPEGFDEGIAQGAAWERTREWLSGGRFWSAILVLLLTLVIARSTVTVHWVDGIDVITPIALLGALVMSVLALLPVSEPLALAIGAVLAPIVAVVGAWPRLHASHPADVLGPQLITDWSHRIQDGTAASDPSFYLFLICLLLWVTGAWLAWCVLRWRKPMLGLIPGAAAFATNVLNIPTDQSGYVFAMLLLTLALLLWTNYTSSIYNATRSSVKLTGDAKWDFWESGLIAMAALILLGILLPPLSTQDRTVDLESGLFTSWAQLQQRLNNPGIFTSNGSRGITGFTDDAKLSGSLQRTRDVVFEYTIPLGQDYAGPKYFRGIDLTYQVGREWRYAPQNGFQVVLAPNTFPDYQEGYEKLAGATIDVTMRAPPTGFPSVLFYPSQLAKINRTTLATQVPLSAGDNSALDSIDRLDSLRPGNSAGTYAVTVDFSTATQSDLESAGTLYPDWVSSFESTPKFGYRTPEVLSAIHNLAEQIVHSANATNPYDEAAAIEAYLRDPQHFKYSLDAVAPAGQDPIYWFLFTGKVGYCEYFASAMGDMLRSLGIPTRLVNGFGPGAFNAQTESWVVRGADAHTWVEVYFPGYGWIPFEPTADDLGQYQPIARGQTGTNPCLRDANCDPNQITAGTTGAIPTPRIRQEPLEPIAGGGGGGISVASISGSVLTRGAAILAALLLLLVVVGLRYLRPRTVTAVWRRMLTLANLAGAERRPGETPLELGRRLGRAFPEAAEPMSALTGAFVVAAYAPPEDAAAQRPAVMEAWVILRPMLLRRVFARLRPRAL
jgi:transglutaminase-like putative cysteine protease